MLCAALLCCAALWCAMSTCGHRLCCCCCWVRAPASPSSVLEHRPGMQCWQAEHFVPNSVPMDSQPCKASPLHKYAPHFPSLSAATNCSLLQPMPQRNMTLRHEQHKQCGPREPVSIMPVALAVLPYKHEPGNHIYLATCLMRCLPIMGCELIRHAR